MVESAKRTCTAIWALAILIFASGLGAADLVPDPEFDGDGLTLTKIGAGKDEALAVGVQDDGRIVVAGKSGDTDNSEMAVLRYLPDGSLDREFSFIGGPLIGTGFGKDGVRGMQLDPEGKIILGGYATELGVTYGALVRLLADGRLDYSFGEQGIVLFSEDESAFYDIVLDEESRVVVVGTAGSGEDRAPLIARFATDGSLDESFAEVGFQIFADLSGELFGLTDTSDGSLIGGGYALDDQRKKQLLLLKLSGDGSLDETFAGLGLLSVNDVDKEIVAHDVDILPDGSIVAVGEAIADDRFTSIMVSRFLADGSPDTTLSETGILYYEIGEQSAAYGGSALDNGVILATGYRQDGGDKNTVVLRLEPSGNELEESVVTVSRDASGEKYEEQTETLKISALQVEEGSFSFAASEPEPEAGSEADLITTVLDGSDEESQAITALENGTIFTAGSSGIEDDSAILVTKYSSEIEPQSIDLVTPDPAEFYRVVTLEITDVTRVGALTGGRIEDRGFDGEACAAACVELCDEIDGEVDAVTDDIDDSDTEDGSGSENELTCEEDCQEECFVPTVDKRGVVYSVDPFPEYDPDGESEAPDDSEDGEDGEAVPLSDDSDEDDGDGILENPFGRDSLFNLDDYFVTEGQTDDGEGVGEYSSDIEEVNPQTAYYVRAYALLSDGTVLYGNEKWFKTKDSCFIATAAFGSIDGQGVRILRQFRDRVLFKSTLGKGVIGWYYQISPPIADIVSESPILRTLVVALIMPVVLWAWLMLNLKLVAAALASAVLVRYWKTGSLRRTFL